MKTPRFAYSLHGSEWENKELLEELLTEPAEASWFVASWQEGMRGQGLLKLVLRIPPHQLGQHSTDEFLGSLAYQLDSALSRFCEERGWPVPRFELQPEPGELSDWAYEIHLPESPVGCGLLKPNKLLAVGEPEGLGRFLGLETYEPVFGLSAKWIGRSQMDQALEADLTVFDGPGVVAAHVLHQVGDRFHNLIGYWELQRWVRPALPEAEALIAPLMRQHSGLILRLVRDMILEGLWLPEAARFFEFLGMGLAELDDSSSPKPETLGELLRKHIIPFNLGRWLNSEGKLDAVEWVGSPEMNQADQTRLLIRLAAALSELQERPESDGIPVVLTDFEERRELCHSLKGIFPHLPILSWPELPDHAQVDVSGQVNAELPVDPSPWHSDEFEVHFKKNS